MTVIQRKQYIVSNTIAIWSDFAFETQQKHCRRQDYFRRGKAIRRKNDNRIILWNGRCIAFIF